MPMGYWGTDSVARTTDASGFDSQNMAQRVRAYWVTTHQYWGRYFGNIASGRYGGGSQAGMAAENLALLNSGFYEVVPINSPGNVGTNDYNAGGLQAQAATADIQTAINAGHMDLPDTSNHAVYLYLDIEYPGSALNREYWKGWHDSVRNSWIVSPRWGSLLGPIYPAAYANPSDATTMDVLTNTPGYICWGLWSPKPSAVACGTYCTIPGPDFGFGQFYAGLTAHLWQYGIHETAGVSNSGCPYTLPNPPGACYSDYPNVDLDETNPSFSQISYMLQIA
jgi:hypothetical protein